MSIGFVGEFPYIWDLLHIGKADNEKDLSAIYDLRTRFGHKPINEHSNLAAKIINS